MYIHTNSYTYILHTYSYVLLLIRKKNKLLIPVHIVINGINAKLLNLRIWAGKWMKKFVVYQEKCIGIYRRDCWNKNDVCAFHHQNHHQTPSKQSSSFSFKIWTFWILRCKVSERVQWFINFLSSQSFCFVDTSSNLECTYVSNFSYD